MRVSPVMTVCATGHSYVVEVELEIFGDCEAELLLFSDEGRSLGLRIGPQGLGLQRAGDLKRTLKRATLRIANLEQEVDFYDKFPGEQWIKATRSEEVSCYEHSVLGGFHDLRPALFALRDGHAIFRSFRFLNETDQLPQS